MTQLRLSFFHLPNIMEAEKLAGGDLMNFQDVNSGKGYLTVRVSTARGAIPLQNAEVTFKKSYKDDSGVLYRVLTDINGMTEKIELPAPPRSNSESPGKERPYAIYNVEAAMPGYYTQIYENVPVFDGISAIQTAELIPLEKNGVSGNIRYDNIRFFERENEYL